jgi:hypothetical protein
VSETVAAVAVLAAVYIGGTFHGLWLAWTQEARTRRWAFTVARAAERSYGLPPVERVEL